MTQLFKGYLSVQWVETSPYEVMEQGGCDWVIMSWAGLALQANGLVGDGWLENREPGRMGHWWGFILMPYRENVLTTLQMHKSYWSLSLSHQMCILSSALEKFPLSALQSHSPKKVKWSGHWKSLDAFQYCYYWNIHIAWMYALKSRDAGRKNWYLKNTSTSVS